MNSEKMHAPYNTIMFFDVFLDIARKIEDQYNIL